VTKRKYLYIDWEVAQGIDHIRGLIPRSTFVNQVLKDVVAKANENGDK